MAATRLQIAARIHFALRRHRGSPVDIAAMLRKPAYARQVLETCRTVGDDELVRLAEQFEALAQRPVAYRVPGRRGVETTLDRSSSGSVRKPAEGRDRHDTSWLRDTSGFGMTEFAVETRERLKQEFSSHRRHWWQPLRRLVAGY